MLIYLDVLESFTLAADDIAQLEDAELRQVLTPGATYLVGHTVEVERREAQALRRLFPARFQRSLTPSVVRKPWLDALDDEV